MSCLVQVPDVVGLPVRVTPRSCCRALRAVPSRVSRAGERGWRRYLRMFFAPPLSIAARGSPPFRESSSGRSRPTTFDAQHRDAETSTTLGSSATKLSNRASGLTDPTRFTDVTGSEYALLEGLTVPGAFHAGAGAAAHWKPKPGSILSRSVYGFLHPEPRCIGPAAGPPATATAPARRGTRRRRRRPPTVVHQMWPSTPLELARPPWQSSRGLADRAPARRAAPAATPNSSPTRVTR